MELPYFLILIVISKFIPCFEDEALGAVFSVLAYLVVFQHTEGLVDTAFATDIFLFQVYLIIIVILFAKIRLIFVITKCLRHFFQTVI